jgi:cell division septum initiation protein DivIVA
MNLLENIETAFTALQEENVALKNQIAILEEDLVQSQRDLRAAKLEADMRVRDEKNKKWWDKLIH